ncbi:MAG: hypothetical protein Q4B54_02440 [Coriobacteriales bacterium]|nr:hypothetical protein [Coriobacteriales bacterium]
MQTSHLRKNIVTALLASTLTVSGAGLVACGGQQNSASTGSSSTTDASSSQSTNSAAAQSSTAPGSAESSNSGDSESNAALKTFYEEAYEAYKGTSEAGDLVYYAANRDSSTCMLVFTDETGQYVIFVGPLVVDGNTYALTDASSGSTILFGVEQNESGTLTIDFGDLGKATVSPAPKEEVFEAVFAIQ